MSEHIVVCCRHLPDRTKSSGELRFWQILRHLRRRARTLSVFAEHQGNRHLFPDLLVWPMSALAAHCPDADVALLEFWFMDEYMPSLRQHGMPLVVDSVDVEFLRRAREQAVHALDGDYYHLEKAREVAAYRSADQVWAVSERDAAHIRDLNPNLVVVPNIFDPVDNVPGFAERRGVCFVGNYSHQPNVDGLRWYREMIYPHVCDIPHTIIGNAAPADLCDMPGFVGGVEASVDYVCRARVSIAPLRYGAGLKGKVLEALACGTPVVTTSIGEEGYGAGRAEAAIIADDPEPFAAAIRRLVADEGAWTRMSRQGRAFAARYAPSAVGAIIDGALDAVLAARRACA